MGGQRDGVLVDLADDDLEMPAFHLAGEDGLLAEDDVAEQCRHHPDLLLFVVESQHALHSELVHRREPEEEILAQDAHRVVGGLLHHADLSLRIFQFVGGQQQCSLRLSQVVLRRMQFITQHAHLVEFLHQEFLRFLQFHT